MLSVSLRMLELSRKVRESHWVGKNPHKGLGVLGFGQHAYVLSSAYTPTYPWFLPFRVEDEHLNVLGVWAHVKEKQERYVRITHQAIDYYRAFLEEGLSVAIGDFNSNTMWDLAHAGSSHSALVEKLEQLQMRSVYHVQTQQQQGRETVSTFYLYRHPDKGYHIDYAFVSQSLLEQTALTIPDPSQWLQRSDHLPLLLDIHLGPSVQESRAQDRGEDPMTPRDAQREGIAIQESHRRHPPTYVEHGLTPAYRTCGRATPLRPSLASENFP
jgi:hypothetical protein